MEKLDFEDLSENGGINYATGYQPRELSKSVRSAMAQDSALVTTPNAGILAMFTTFVDPRIIDILVEPMKAAQIFGEQLKGKWADDEIKYLTSESTGEVSTYGDNNGNGVSGSNENWETRDAYRYQVFVEVGELEAERAAAAKIDLPYRKQKAAALALNKYQNKTYFFGVEGLRNWGVLNDPALPAPITGSPWAPMSADQVYAEIQRLYTQLISQTGGLIDMSTPMKLVMSPTQQTHLTKTNMYKVNVKALLAENFPNLTIETAPEYSTAAGELVQLIAQEYQGVRTVEPTFTEKMRVHPMVQRESSWRQKRSQTTAGSVVLYPLFVGSLLSS